MHATEREALILSLLTSKGFISFKDLEQQLDGSPATIRRDLERLHTEGKLVRVRGGARLPDDAPSGQDQFEPRLSGVPFHENVGLNREQKEQIGKVAASLCDAGEGVMIDGGSTTLQMCNHLNGLRLQVLTNSLHIVLALLNQRGTRVMVPGGAVFPEQNIILSVFGEDCMPRFFAPKLFMGAASIGPQGLMQEDVVLVAGERRFVERAEQIIVLADATKFDQPSGNVVCPLSDIDKLITDSRLSDKAAKFLEAAGVEILIADDR